MYSRGSGLVIGFHACKRDVSEELLSGSADFKPSENVYDWLGSGMYFWEKSQHRAERFAQDRKIEDSVVVGAAIDLGFCLDFTDSESLFYLSQSYFALKEAIELSNLSLPSNKKSGASSNNDALRRDLDCAVINFLHSQREDKGDKSYDSVRGVFWEGKDLYPGAGFKEKNHVQICVRNPNCIKGFFLPRKEDPKFNSV